ncbi:MAG: sigma-70 family RNA polymerase sigma factor [Clostridia bacterium]|nr:sigma-70 family RNA polymerase sigma factor [Clostridia bacterium]
MQDYKRLTDEELCSLGQKGDTESIENLIERYRQTVLAISRSYYLYGGDIEDLSQEGMIGVFRAIMTFDKDKSSFKSYAILCIKSSILTLIKKHNRDKNKPLNHYIPLTGYQDFDADKTIAVTDNTVDPEIKYIDKESELELYNHITNVLSKYENRILKYYLQGYSYEEMAKITNKDTKSIDNALQRIRKKITKATNL